MTNQAVETFFSLNDFEPYILFSLLVVLALIFLKLLLTKSPSATILNLPPGLSRSRAEKPRSDIVFDLGKLQSTTVASKEGSGETNKYDAALHQFNIRIKEEYSKKKNLDPFAVIEEMKKKHINPDITTFNTLLDICFEQNNMDVAFNFFSYMKNLERESILNHQDVSPMKVDIISYNTMLKGLSLQVSDKNDEVENEAIIRRCLTLLDEIKQSDIKPNEITFNTLIDALVKADEMDLAFRYFSEMKDNDLQPDNFTYATIIKGIKNHHINQQKETKDPSIKSTKNKMFDSEYSSLDKVFEILTSCKQGKYVKPDEILFNCVMDACVKFKNMNKALEVYDEMIKMGLQPSSITYGILIKGFGNERQFDGVMNIFEKIKAISSKLIKSLHQYQDNEQALLKSVQQYQKNEKELVSKLELEKMKMDDQLNLVKFYQHQAEDSKKNLNRELDKQKAYFEKIINGLRSEITALKSGAIADF